MVIVFFDAVAAGDADETSTFFVALITILGAL